jgi:hypothetical protein
MDQYYYHFLQDTTKRDKDQKMWRYQERNDLKPKVMTMVDQLWLWVLNSTEGGVNTVISCFPAVRLKQGVHPDWPRRTDVIRGINRYMITEPSAVKSAYDLAGLIVA